MITVAPIGEYRKGFKVEGHANYAERGQDIVCASISALTQGCLLGLRKLSLVETLLDDGLVEVIVINDTELTDLLIDNMIDALQMIEMQYPSNIYVKGDSEHAERTWIFRGQE